MSDSSMQPGENVTPSIRLVRMLGQGGMGSVWIADHLGLHTQVVVKFISLEHAMAPEARARFEREAALAAQAKSPHVVQIFDHGLTNGGVPFIAMELLEGEDLGKRLTRDGVIPPALFANWLSQACKGLGRAHSKGIVHRDIKPENLFLCDLDGEILVKLLDFGVAKGEGGPGSFLGTKTGAFLGTAYYMSPEQMMGSKNVDLRCDLWALGVVAYYALTGIMPFDAEAIGALAMAITKGEFVPPSMANTTLTPAIDAWMKRALHTSPDHRFASAKEMGDAFAAAVSGTSVVRSSSAPPAPAAGVDAAPPWTPGIAVTSRSAPPRFSTSAGMSSDRDRRSAVEIVDGRPKARSRTLLLGLAGAMAIAAVGAVFLLRPGPGTRDPASANAQVLASAPPPATQPPSVTPVDSAVPLPATSASAPSTATNALPAVPSAKPAPKGKVAATPPPATPPPPAVPPPAAPPAAKKGQFGDSF